MIDNEIVKALECCMGCACKECHYHNDADIYDVTCKDRLIIDALNLINRQKAEIEEHRRVFETIHKEIKAVKVLYAEDIGKARAEAIKEFAERLKIDFGHGVLGMSSVGAIIDNLVKEMTGGNKA